MASAVAAWCLVTAHAQQAQQMNDAAKTAVRQPAVEYDRIHVVPPALPANAVVLDRVVAVINSDVILQSDVLEEQRFTELQPFQAKGEGSEDQQALDRVVNRTLILQQLAELQTSPRVTDAAMNAEIADIRKHLPVCGAGRCETAEGWHSVLAKHGFTEAQFTQRWKVRMLVLGFIEQRFRAGVRISKPEIQEYYDKSLVPEFKKRNLPPPALATVTQRIDEILLQQHVNGLLAEWLNSLKDQGNVAILDPEYKQQSTPGLSSTADPAEGDQE